MNFDRFTLDHLRALHRLAKRPGLLPFFKDPRHMIALRVALDERERDMAVIARHEQLHEQLAPRNPRR